MLKNFLLFLIGCFLCTAGSGQQTVGLFTRTTSSYDGYVLFAPNSSTTTYLIDKCGKLVHSWPNTHRPGLSVYLLPDGNLLRTGSMMNNIFTSGGNGGIIEKIDWNGNVTWNYTISSTTECQHHDICPLPNGNILVIVWESKTASEATTAGRDPSKLGASLWSEKIIELQPTGSNTANIVWEWHVWDHLAQEYDNTKNNYTIINQHPELVNLNYVSGPQTASDWLHMNSVDYNANLDQIIVSLHNTSEFWIIDHSTTTVEAASHTGGARNKGGDLLYRWGNPAAYNRGAVADQKLYKQHNAHWVKNGLPDSGKIMVFNNGMGRPQGNYSTVELMAPPVNGTGDYVLTGSQAYPPDSAYWKYQAPNPTDFYASNISGAQRLANGNTIICEGPAGKFFEIDGAKNIVWEYKNPVNASGPANQGNAISQNTVFRCTQYDLTFSGFTGHSLTPGNPIELNPLIYNCIMNTNTSAENIGSYHSEVRVDNPFSNSLFITSPVSLKEVTITLYDISGKQSAMWQMDLNAGQKEALSINNILPPGLYILDIRNNNYVGRVKLMCVN